MKPARRGMSLQDALAKSVAAETNAQPPALPESPALAPVPAAESDRTAPAKVGVPLGFLVSDDDRQRLKRIAVDERKSLQEIQHEAVSKWLVDHGYPALEPQTANRPSGRRR